MSDQPTLFPPDRDSVIVDHLERYGLPPNAKFQIIALLEGRLNESSLVCCHSGCVLCSELIYNCLQDVKKELAS
ncbi:MAG TPA: hypothetical protein PK079_08785 [Leptospiraceae bacterium]|nr:hypothetical protein [Leptospiraceae bacterium]HMW04256.1 hypothetical protein [Leptospiraceae bacterium]HMX30602.1 hypothetical protein [Leptospiraceae bacterium]HMY31302.1 hypothetical protein [Leptospiraceae bacterium]HMZ63415.1 hypothetical protein [Leptospiraceae bacterium]